MERKVPTTASEEIELYLRTIYSLLRSTTDVQIRTLEEVHTATNSLLHPGARSEQPDVSALIYTWLRLPDIVHEVRSVVMGQSTQVFARHGFVDVENWCETPARARRRRFLFDGRDTLACFIASRSDIDDLVPSLTAYQIEWNKLHWLLKQCPPRLLQENHQVDSEEFIALAEHLKMSLDDLTRLQTVWGKDFQKWLLLIAKKKMDLRIRLLEGSLTEYWRATRAWLDNIERECPGLTERPVYFISSNTHSVVNLLTGFAAQNQAKLIRFLEHSDDRDLLQEWNDIQKNQVPSSASNFLYYVLKKYQQTPEGQSLIIAQRDYEREHGIKRVASVHTLDIEAQVIDLCCLDPQMIDPRLSQDDFEFLRGSDALIFNIDYPLGLAAYNILAKVAEHFGPILGVYVMGKAATMNGRIGDVMVPNVVQDEHSLNTYLFQNAFTGADVSPYLVYGTVLDNQKTLSVLGTFLQNAEIMDVMYREGYTDIEMEAGPYLSAVYEMYRPKRHPVNEIVNLYGVPFDIGILHYASDKPLSKGKNLGAGTLSYFGMDSTYACSVAILKRIVEKERQRLKRL